MKYFVIRVSVKSMFTSEYTVAVRTEQAITAMTFNEYQLAEIAKDLDNVEFKKVRLDNNYGTVKNRPFGIYRPLSEFPTFEYGERNRVQEAKNVDIYTIVAKYVDSENNIKAYELCDCYGTLKTVGLDEIDHYKLTNRRDSSNLTVLNSSNIGKYPEVVKPGYKVTIGNYEYCFASKMVLLYPRLDWNKVDGVEAFGWGVRMLESEDYDPNEKIEHNVLGIPVRYFSYLYYGRYSIKYLKVDLTNPNICAFDSFLEGIKPNLLDLTLVSDMKLAIIMVSCLQDEDARDFNILMTSNGYNALIQRMRDAGITRLVKYLEKPIKLHTVSIDKLLAKIGFVNAKGNKFIVD